MKKGIFKNFTKFTEKRFCQSLILRKMHVSGLQHYKKSDPGTGVFLRIL